MSHSNCIVCLQNKPAQIPHKYLQFSNNLFINIFNALSMDTNRLESASDTTFSFCSHCRVYLMKFAKLNEKLESLNQELGQLQFQEKIRKINFAQRQNHNDSTGSLRNPKITLVTPQILQSNGSGKSKIKTAEAIEMVETIEVSDDDDINDAPNVNGSQHSDRSLSDNESKMEQVASSVKPQGRGQKATTPKKLPKSVKLVSEKSFVFKGKFPFKLTDIGFKCGTCGAKSGFCKSADHTEPLWSNIIKHIKKWHFGSGRVRKLKVHQRFIEIAPGRFQYGEYSFEKHENKWRCLKCGYLANIGKDKFRQISFHIIHKHENPEKPMCELCGNQFSTPDYLRRHKITEHSKLNASYPCSSCEKKFKTALQARTHETRVHSGRHFQLICDVCGRKFKTKSQLQGHMFSHNGDRTFKCKDCGKAYATHSGLYVHQNSRHTGKHKYICDICGMNFTQPYAITRHKKTAHKK